MVHGKRNRKLFLLALAVMSLLLAGSTRKPEKIMPDPAKEFSAAAVKEFSGGLRDGFQKIAEEDPVILLQYSVSR